MAQYEVSVFRYASDGENDGFEIQICATPPLEEHIGLLNAERFIRSETLIHDDHSEHYLRLLDKTTSNGAFCTRIVCDIAEAINAKVKKLLLEDNTEFCTASLLVGDKTYDSEAKKPGQPTKKKDAKDGFYDVTPLAFLGEGKVKDMRANESCKRQRVE